jgi:hypothetical protein
MRLPHVDGATLLHEVMRQVPAAMRVVLSGQAEVEVLARVIPVAHRLLSKPCNTVALRAILADLVVPQTGSSAAIAALLGGAVTIPAVPHVITELTIRLTEPEAQMDQLVDLIRQDPAISARVLHSEFARAFPPTCPSFRHEGFTRRVVRVCDVARYITAAANMSALDDLVVMHDIGQLVLASRQGERYETVLVDATQGREPLHVIERRTFGVDHAELGAYLLRLWGLADALADLVAHHHDPECFAPEPLGALDVLHVASTVVDTAGDEARFRATVDQRALAKLAPAEVVGILSRYRDPEKKREDRKNS